MSMVTFSVPVGASVIIDGKKVEVEEIDTTISTPKTPAKVVPIRRVYYTSKAGNKEIYGVFWEGTPEKGPDAGIPKVGLRRLTKQSDYVLMAKYSKYNKGFFVSADKVVSAD
jgi:hypothetical protein